MFFVVCSAVCVGRGGGVQQIAAETGDDSMKAPKISLPFMEEEVEVATMPAQLESLADRYESSVPLLVQQMPLTLRFASFESRFICGRTFGNLLLKNTGQQTPVQETARRRRVCLYHGTNGPEGGPTFQIRGKESNPTVERSCGRYHDVPLLALLLRLVLVFAPCSRVPSLRADPYKLRFTAGRSGCLITNRTKPKTYLAANHAPIDPNDNNNQPSAVAETKGFVPTPATLDAEIVGEIVKEDGTPVTSAAAAPSANKSKVRDRHRLVLPGGGRKACRRNKYDDRNGRSLRGEGYFLCLLHAWRPVCILFSYF